MQENKFEFADVVKLLSGGPRMVIVGLCPKTKGHYECMWFDEYGHKKQDSFPGSLLRLAPIKVGDGAPLW